MNKRLTYIVIAVVVLVVLAVAGIFTYRYVRSKKAPEATYAPNFLGYDAEITGTIDNGFKLKTLDGGKDITAYYDENTLISVRRVEYVPTDPTKSSYVSEQLEPADLVDGQVVKVVPPDDKKDATEFVAQQIAVIIERQMTVAEFDAAHAVVDPNTVPKETTDDVQTDQ